MAFRIQAIPGDKVRVPAPDPGTATVVSRYDKERTVLLHPDDFHRLQRLDDLLTDIASPSLGDPSEEAIRAHREEDRPSHPVTDAVVLADLFS